MLKEIWRTHTDYPSYLISNYGRIKTFNWKNHGLERIMKPAYDANGYLRTMLKHKDGHFHTIKVHRIIGQVYIENPENKPCINHIDYIRSNNIVTNLEWVTIKENAHHSKCNLRSVMGENNPAATITEKEVLEIRARYPFRKKLYRKGELTKRELAQQYNVTFGCIKNIVTNKTWKHLL